MEEQMEALSRTKWNIYQISEAIREIIEGDVDEETGEINYEVSEQLEAMQMAKEDTTRPRLIKVTVLDNRHVSAEFSKCLLQGTYTNASFVIRDTRDRAGRAALRAAGGAIRGCCLTMSLPLPFRRCFFNHSFSSSDCVLAGQWIATAGA